MKKKSPRAGKGKAIKVASPKAPRGSKRTQQAQNAMSGALLEKIKEEASKFNPSSRKVYERAMQGHSRKDAMTAFRISCMGYNPNEVKECTALWCPLYPYR